MLDIVEDNSHQLCHWLEDLKKIGAINPEEASNIFHRMLVRMMFYVAGKQDSSFETRRWTSMAEIRGMAARDICCNIGEHVVNPCPWVPEAVAAEEDAPAASGSRVQVADLASMNVPVVVAERRGFKTGVMLAELGSSAVFTVKSVNRGNKTFKLVKRTLGLTGAFSTDILVAEALNKFKVTDSRKLPDLMPSDAMGKNHLCTMQCVEVAAVKARLAVGHVLNVLASDSVGVQGHDIFMWQYNPNGSGHDGGSCYQSPEARAAVELREDWKINPYRQRSGWEQDRRRVR